MTAFRSSRYLRQPLVQVPGEVGTTQAYEQRDTTVPPSKQPSGTRVVRVAPGDAMPEMARKALGSQALWWLVADFNPATFYPLDLQDGDRLAVPPSSAVARYRRGST